MWDLKDEASVSEAVFGSQPAQDVFQRHLLVRREAHEGEAALVAEKLFSSGGVLSAHNRTVHHLDRKGERADGRGQLQRAPKPRTKEIAVFDAGAHGAEIHQAGIQRDPDAPTWPSGNSHP
jgi:hypothetical protein